MKLINYYGNTNKTGIYCIKNLANNKYYIGSTKTSFSIRKNKHLRLLRKNKHYNEHLQNAWNYYGEENFSFEILIICEPNECEKYEGKTIELYSSNKRKFGYNIACVSSYRYKYNISETHNNEKSLRKINKGLIVNGLNTNEKGLPKPFKIYDLNGNFIREYNSAKEYSEINNVKARGTLSGILKKRKLKYGNYIILFSNDILTNEDINYVRNKIMKRIILYDLNDNYLNEFDNAERCANYIGCKDAEVRMCCLGKRSRIKNYKTKYVNYE